MVMNKFVFKKAIKKESKLRMGIAAPSGAGKTYSALSLATHLAGENGRIALIDTEHKSASKYADIFEFDAVELDSFSPDTYSEAIEAAVEQGYSVIIVDSMSHAWSGKDGALEQVDSAAKRSNSGNKFNAWREVTPMHNRLVDTILRAKAHVICTMRSKTEYIIEDIGNGKKVPRRVGMAPIQRDGMEYEFDIFAEMNHSHEFMATKTRCPLLAGKVYSKPGRDLANIILGWLDGEKVIEEPSVVEVAEQTRKSLLTDPEIIALFDELKAPPAKRMATIDKYTTRDAVMKALESRVTEQRKSAQA